MRKFLKYLFRFLLLLIVAVVWFFLWASSPTLDEKDYARLITNTYNSDTTHDSIFSIATYNIGYLSGMTNNKPVAKPKQLFDDNLKKVLEETRHANPDIIAFQEIDYNAARSYYVNQQDKIAELGYNYVAKAINWDERYVPFPYWPPSMHFGKVVSGQSILSKFPLKNHERMVLARVADSPFYRDALYLERLAQIVMVDLGGTNVILINVHLEAFDKKTRVIQFEEVMQVFNKYSKTYPTILLGDFNSEARKPDAIIQKLIANPDIGNAAFIPENPENTFNSRDPFKRIDYIFYTKNNIEYIDGAVLTQFGEASDHLPVMMRFKLKRKPQL